MKRCIVSLSYGVLHLMISRPSGEVGLGCGGRAITVERQEEWPEFSQ